MRPCQVHPTMIGTGETADACARLRPDLGCVNLPKLVEPDAGDLEAEKVGDIFVIVQRAKHKLRIKQLFRARNYSAPAMCLRCRRKLAIHRFWKQFQPRFDRGVYQLRSCVSYYSPARMTNTLIMLLLIRMPHNSAELQLWTSQNQQAP